MSDFEKGLREIAERWADARRMKGNPKANADQHFEWLAADEIKRLQARVAELEQRLKHLYLNWHTFDDPFDELVAIAGIER